MSSKRDLEDYTDHVHQSKKQNCKDPEKSPTQELRQEEDPESEKQEVEAKTLLQLPLEMKNMILDYVKGDDSMVQLSETCQRFNEICTPRLLLRLDFDRIYEEGVYPQLQRCYTAIQLFGDAIDDRSELFLACLEDSRDSVTSLFIGDEAQRPELTTITMRTLLSILDFFPNLKEVRMCDVDIISPPIKFTAIKDQEIKLRQLKVLHLDRVSENVLTAFKKVLGLEEFGISEVTRNLCAVRKFISAQKRLKILKANIFKFAPVTVMKKLTEIHSTFQNPDDESDDESGDEDNLTSISLKFAPNLKRIRISRVNWPVDPERWHIDPIPKLESIEIDARTMENFNIQVILRLYPQLKSFKSMNYEWHR